MVIQGWDPECLAGTHYLRRHDEAAKWAKLDRELLAMRFVQALGTDADSIWDVATTVSPHGNTTKPYAFTARVLCLPNVQQW